MPFSARAGEFRTRLTLMRASDALATNVLMYAIPLLVLTTTGSTSLTGVAFLMEWLPRLAAFTIGGPLVDRYRADRVFRAATAVRSLLLITAAAALALLPGSGALTTATVMAAGAISGLLAQAAFLAVETIGAATSRKAGEQAHRVQSVQIGIDQSALLVGPLLGGLLLLLEPSCLMAVVAVLSLAAMLATTWQTDEPFAPSVMPPSVLSQLRTGWCTVLAIPALTCLVAGLIASNLAIAVAQASAPITVLQGFGGSSLTVGAVWSAAGVLSLTAVAASRYLVDRYGLWPVGAFAAGTACVACFAIALAPELVSYAVAIGVMMAGEGALTVVLRTLRARLIPRAVFGSTLSVTIVLVVIPMPLAGALVALLPASALNSLLLICAVVQGLAMALAFRGLWRHRTSYTHSAVRS